MADSLDGTVDHLVETWPTTERPATKTSREAYLVQIYPTGPAMGLRFPLSKSQVLLGRAEECDIPIKDHRVSRHHVRIDGSLAGYFAVDLDSRNGTFVNDLPTSTARLRDGDYLRVGNHIYRFLTGANVEAEYHEEIYRLSMADPLTGISNKRHLLEFLDRELARSLRHRRPLALVLFDIDGFKAINDDLGHLGGDYTLRELANRLRGTIRKEELLARYGGEEFALVLVETPHAGAVELAERVRKLVETHPFEFECRRFPLTISLGVASTAGGENLTATELIRQADERLYQAKGMGKNRVVG